MVFIYQRTGNPCVMTTSNNMQGSVSVSTFPQLHLHRRRGATGRTLRLPSASTRRRLHPPQKCSVMDVMNETLRRTSHTLPALSDRTVERRRGGGGRGRAAGALCRQREREG
jgi:hypothetical protein